MIIEKLTKLQDYLKKSNVGKRFLIIEKLTKLGDPKRKIAAVVTVLVVACICYFAITKGSITKLKAANASYADVQTEYESSENQQADFRNVQKLLGVNEKRVQEYQRQCFSSSGAAQFFENINAMASANNLKPISRVILEPKNLAADKVAGEVDDENAKPKPKFLKTQSVKITVAGKYFDIVAFGNQLTGRPQKVCITDLRITLPGGAGSKPKASFEITLVIDLSKDMEK